ncbi:MAG: alcohol dehydrogenase catalytic domain-containing protein, partial [Gemmobacter sp.]
MSTMKALVCVEPGRFERAMRPRPEDRPGHIRVRIGHIGICGTDYHIYGGQQPFLSYPRVMGHELSGEIAEASEGSRFRPGDPVYIVPYLHCGHCIACRA